MVSVDTVNNNNGHFKKKAVWFSAQELCESGGGRPGLPVPNSPHGLCGRKQHLKKRWFGSEDEVAFLGSPSLILIVLVVFVDSVKQHSKKKGVWFRAHELCESRGGRPGLPVPDSPYSVCGRKATLNCQGRSEHWSCVEVEMAVLGSPSLIISTVFVDVK